MRELPRGWVSIGFDEAVDVLSDHGRRIKQKDYLASGKLPVVDQGEGLIGGYTDDLGAEVTSLRPVIVFGDHTRRFKLVKFSFAVGADGVKLFSPGSIWNPEFLFFQLVNLDLTNRGYGRHYQHLRKEMLQLPPAVEQSRIVAKLDELLTDLDAGVAELKAAQKKLGQYRQSLLKAAVDGDLFAEVFPTVTLGELVTDIGQGWSPKCESGPATTADQWAVMKTTAIQPLAFDGSHNKALPAELKPRENLELKQGDLLTTRAGPRNRVGVTCLVRTARQKLILCDKAYRIRCEATRILPEFLELVLNAPHIVQRLDELKTGISDSGLNLTQDRFFTLEIPTPRLDIQREVVKRIQRDVESIRSQEQAISHSLKQSSAQRQNILRSAFSGQLVPQDPSDEPASALLDRIRAERATSESVKKPRIKKPRSQP